MNIKKRVLPALLLSVFLGAAAPAVQAQQRSNPGVFSNVIVFGDSLSDAGYFRPFLTGLGLPPSVVATLGRFTTNPGPVWSELVSQYYGVTPAASNANGFIFAQGGARVATASSSTPPGSAQRPVSTQIDEYIARAGGADPNALYAVWAGANDIFQNLGAFSAGAITQAQLQTNVLAAATAEIQQIARLQAAGARYIIVFGLPDIGATPQFSGSAATAGAVTQLSAGYNTTLFSGLAGAGIRVIPVDAFSLLREVAANPAAYGFTNITGVACGPFPPITTTPSSQFCLPANLVAPNAAQTYLFADGVHPTTAAQAIVAQFVESLIDGPMQYSLLAEAPLRTRASLVRTLNDGLLNGRYSQVGKWSVFAAADGGDFDVEKGGGTQGLNSNLNTLAVGVTVRASDAVTLGAAYGRSRLHGTFGNDAGNFRTYENSVSAFASLKWGGFYGTGLVSLADIEFNETERKIVLGPLTRVATSNPEGTNVSSYFTAGYDFPIGRFTIGPAVTLTTANVDVNQFDEAGAGSANLRIHKQKRRSEVWGIGLRASAQFGAWTPYVRITADKERRDDARFVTATPLSMIATGNSYDLPAYSSDNSFMTTTAGVTGWIMPNVALSFAYYKVSNRSGIKEDAIGGTLSVKF